MPPLNAIQAPPRASAPEVIGGLCGGTGGRTETHGGELWALRPRVWPGSLANLGRRLSGRLAVPGRRRRLRSVASGRFLAGWQAAAKARFAWWRGAVDSTTPWLGHHGPPICGRTESGLPHEQTRARPPAPARRAHAFRPNLASSSAAVTGLTISSRWM
jgi:hypothetical protein